METPRYGHAPHQMRLCEKDGFWDRPDIRVGDFYWQLNDGRVAEHFGKRRLCVMIPCLRPPGFDQFTMSEWTIDHRNSCNAQWSWDGNEAAPTLSPSLHAVGIWHGFVRAGQLIEA